MRTDDGARSRRIFSVLADHHSYRPAEDRPAVEAGPGGAEDRQVLGVRRRRAAAADGHVRADRPLAGVHLVRDRQRRAASRRQQGGVAGHTGQRHAPVLLAQQHGWAEYKGESSDGRRAVGRSRIAIVFKRLLKKIPYFDFSKCLHCTLNIIQYRPSATKMIVESVKNVL